MKFQINISILSKVTSDHIKYFVGQQLYAQPKMEIYFMVYNLETDHLTTGMFELENFYKLVIKYRKTEK